MHSYNKYPVVRQNRVHKKSWNRKIRHDKTLWSLKGAEYKRVYQNWNHWHYMWTLEDALTGRLSKTHSREWIIEYWKRCCYRK